MSEPSNKLRDLLNAPSVNLSAVSRETGITLGTLRGIKDGKSYIANVTVGNFIKLAHYYGMSADELYTGKPFTPPSSIDVRFNSLDASGKSLVMVALDAAEARQTLKEAPSQAV